MNNLCPHAINESDFKHILIKCILSNDICGFCRYCNTENGIVMTSNFYKHGCVIKEKHDSNIVRDGEFMAETNIKTKANKEEKSTIHTLIATVNYSYKNKTSILYTQDDVECSIFINGEYNNKVEIKYVGDTFNTNNIKSIKEVK